MQALFRALEPNHPRRIIRVFEWKIIRCPETGGSKEASLRNSARSLIERRAEPLGNLNKGLPSAPRVAYPFMRHVHAHDPQSEHNRAQSQPNRLNQRTSVRNRNKSGPQPWPFPQLLHLFLFDSPRSAGPQKDRRSCARDREEECGGGGGGLGLPAPFSSWQKFRAMTTPHSTSMAMPPPTLCLTAH